MIHGVLIQKGPKNWQIIQQLNGKAVIELSGQYLIKATNDAETPTSVDGRVFIRVLNEDDGHIVLPWTLCTTYEQNNVDGLWNATFELPAGGLYRIETCLNQNCEAIEWSKRGDMIHHIGVGDVYMIAGQSNSAGYGRGVVLDAPELGVHLLKNDGCWQLATHPFNDSTHTLHEVNMETCNPGHSPYLMFGKLLKKNLGYPIGFLQSALGASPLSRWNKNEEGSLYKNMLEIIDEYRYGIKGILWYQGCSDTALDLANTYKARFIEMIQHVREDIQQPDLPILTCQLNRLLSEETPESDLGWAKIREAQRIIPHEIDNVYVVPTLDCLLSDLIHNSPVGNIMIGERLASLALEMIYNKSFLGRAPEISTVFHIKDHQLRLTFLHVHERLDFFEVSPKSLPFIVEDQFGINKITKYYLDSRDSVIIELERPLTSEAMVHGAHQQNPQGVLPQDIGSYLPMLSFYGKKVQNL